jgi:flavin reductase (DIM6/NTAB) family NADH-FMN oxidoreductase RutF
MTIHHSHPFADPPSARDAVRAFRGRLVAAVTLWTAAGQRRPAGLTVSSVLVASGTPPRLLALLDPLADLTDALLASGRAAVTILGHDDQRLAEVFAGQAPAPGGAFRQAEFTDTQWGPVLTGAAAWAGVRLESTATVGYSEIVTCVIEQVAAGGDDDPLVHYRGRYPRLHDVG